MSCDSLGAGLYHEYILLTVHLHEKPFTRKNYTFTFFSAETIYLLIIQSSLYEIRVVLKMLIN